MRDKYNRKIDSILYPAAFDKKEYNWLCVKEALDAHEKYVKEYLEIALKKVIEEMKN